MSDKKWNTLFSHHESTLIDYQRISDLQGLEESILILSKILPNENFFENKNFITSPSIQCVLHDRWNTVQKCPYLFPPTYLVESEADLDDLFHTQVLKKCIVKTKNACGSHETHIMTIFNTDSIPKISFPSIIQSYVNHDGIFFKVFMIGEANVFIFERTDLGDEVKTFDSQKMISPKTCVKKYSPMYSNISDLIIECSRIYQIDLFGIDVVQNELGELFVIDVNFFPTFREIENFGKYLDEYCLSKLF